MARSSFTFKHAALGLLGSSLALTLVGWMPAIPPVADAAARPDAQTPSPRVDGTADVLRIERLTAFVASAAQPRTTVRNPFAPGSVDSDRARVPDTVQAAQLRPAVPAPVTGTTDESAAVPALVGIAVEETAVGPTRTAVFLTADGDVHFAAAGHGVGAGRFRVSEISTLAVVLISSTTGAATRLVLQ